MTPESRGRDDPFQTQSPSQTNRNSAWGLNVTHESRQDITLPCFMASASGEVVNRENTVWVNRLKSKR